MMKHKTTLLYIIIAALSCALLLCLYHRTDTKHAMGNQQSSGMVHQMSEDAMMEEEVMNSMMKGMTAELNGKTGDNFDKAFLSGMVVHHEGAVEMAKMVIKTSRRPELIKLAEDIIKAQTEEISMMKNWEKVWFAK